MLELGRKEQHLMGGIGLQILIIGLLVFAYTQAIRQVNLGRALSLRLQEQLAVAREQVARQGGRADPAALQGQVAELKSSLTSPDGLEMQARRLEQLAGDHFGIRDARVTVGATPAGKLSVPLGEESSFGIRLYALEMRGTASSRSIAGLVSEVADPAFKPLCPLVAMDLKAADSAGRPVEFLLRWMAAVSQEPSAPSGEGTLPAAGPPLPWGWREEPFLSPLEHPNALRIPRERLGMFHLSGIVQEGSGTPACVVNGQMLRPGDWIRGYQVVLISSGAVLLEGKSEELVLSLS